MQNKLFIFVAVYLASYEIQNAWSDFKSHLFKLISNYQNGIRLFLLNSAIYSVLFCWLLKVSLSSSWMHLKNNLFHRLSVCPSDIVIYVYAMNHIFFNHTLYFLTSGQVSMSLKSIMGHHSNIVILIYVAETGCRILIVSQFHTRRQFASLYKIWMMLDRIM